MPANKTTAIPLTEFDREMETTRNMLERVPEGHDGFKPHEKSMQFSYLAFLVAAIPNWIDQTLRTEFIDLGANQSTRGEGLSSKDLLQIFDKNVKVAREALQTITGADLETDWSLKHGEKVLMTMPRGDAARNHLSHLIHHRGQLSVYERMLDAKLPQIYGPTADAPWQS